MAYNMIITLNEMPVSPNYKIGDTISISKYNTSGIIIEVFRIYAQVYPDQSRIPDGKSITENDINMMSEKIDFDGVNLKIQKNNSTEYFKFSEYGYIIQTPEAVISISEFKL